MQALTVSSRSRADFRHRRRARVWTVVAAFLAAGLLAPAPTAAVPSLPGPQETDAPSAPAILAAIEGLWTGSGSLFGRPATFSMEWTRVLGGSFLRLDFANALVTEDGDSPVLGAHAYYRVGDGSSLEGHWFDTRGQVITLRATATAAQIVTDWESAGIERGRTTYRLLDDGRFEVIDEVERDGALAEFGRAIYERQ